MSFVYRTNNENKEKWYVRLFISVIILKGTNLTFSGTEMIPDQIEFFILGLVILFYVISLFYNTFGINKKISLLTLCLGFGLSSLYLYSLAIYPEISNNIIKRFIWTTVFGMSCFWCTLKTHNIKGFLNLIKPYSYIFTLLGTMIFWGDITKLSSNMTFSGMMLFPFCLHFYYALNKSKIALIICLYELFIIFIHGSRGGILDIFMFILLYYLIKGLKDVKIRRKILLIIPIVFVIVISIVTNLSYFSSILINNGIYIRNLEFLKQGKFLNDSGRYAIQSEYLELICNSFPIRFRVVDLYNNGTSYPHNIFIEILYNYGYFLGGIILLFLFYSLFRCLIKLRNERYDLLMILMCSGLFPLLTSFTYFEWPLFWGFLGYLISHYRLRYQTDMGDSYENLVCYQ